MKTVKIIRARSLSELDTIVTGHQKPISFLAGGTDLMVYGRRNEIHSSIWIDISAIDELRGISEVGDELHIGALTTFAEISASTLVARYLPALHRAAGMVGSPLIRNRATIGGNVGNASPAGDSIPPLFVHGARIVIHRPGAEEKRLKMNNVFMGPKSTVLQHGELITSIQLPKVPSILGSFKKLGQRNSLRIAKVSMAISTIVNDRTIEDICIAAGAAGPTVFRAYRTERCFKGGLINAESLREAQLEICEECLPIDDIRSTADYRRAVMPVLLERLLLEDILPLIP